MKILKSPEPDRHGNFEFLRFPDWKVRGQLSKGWTDTEDEASLGLYVSEKKEVDIAAEPWQEFRMKIKEMLDLDAAPVSKEKARALLEEAGFRVTG